MDILMTATQQRDDKRSNDSIPLSSWIENPTKIPKIDFGDLAGTGLGSTHRQLAPESEMLDGVAV
jgi:hypothetical protein